MKYFHSLFEQIIHSRPSPSEGAEALSKNAPCRRPSPQDCMPSQKFLFFITEVLTSIELYFSVAHQHSYPEKRHLGTIISL